MDDFDELRGNVGRKRARDKVSNVRRGVRLSFESGFLFVGHGRVMQEGAITEGRPKGRRSAQHQTTRKSFKTLQHVATDKENLTGRPKMAKDSKIDIAIEKKNAKDKKFVDKDIQVNIKFAVEDLTSEAGPSENYWQVVAEKRRIALEETLEENRNLHEKIEKLTDENKLLREMVEESKSLVDVLTEMVDEQQEESGIDLGETSSISLNEDNVESKDKSTKKSTDNVKPKV